MPVSEGQDIVSKCYDYCVFCSVYIVWFIVGRLVLVLYNKLLALVWVIVGCISIVRLVQLVWYSGGSLHVIVQCIGSNNCVVKLW